MFFPIVVCFVAVCQANSSGEINAELIEEHGVDSDHEEPEINKQDVTNQKERQGRELSYYNNERRNDLEQLGTSVHRRGLEDPRVSQRRSAVYQEGSSEYYNNNQESRDARFEDDGRANNVIINRRHGTAPNGSWTWADGNAFAPSPQDETFEIVTPMPVSVNRQSAARSVPSADKIPSANHIVPATHKMKVGDWVAQWDEVYKAWFFYNVETQMSTWVKPKELWHVSFNQPPPDETLISMNLIDTGESNIIKDNLLINAPSLAKDTPEDKIFLSSDNGTEFFGFPIPQGKRDPYSGDISGVDPWTAFYDSLAGIYDNIVKSYVQGIYEDVIEEYTLATVKLIGWFFFGSFLIAKGAVMNGINGSKQLMGGRELNSQFKLNMTIPGLEDIPASFSLDNSLLSCYKDRQTCVDDDLPGEVTRLIDRVTGLKKFATEWLDLGEKIAHITIEGDTWDW